MPHCHLFHENEVDGRYQAQKGCEVVPLQRLAFEEEYGEEREDDERYCFLDYFELHQRECAAVSREAYAVCQHLAAVFGQGNAPRQQYDDIQRRVAAYYFHLLQLEVPVPCEYHEDVRHDKQGYCDYGVFHILMPCGVKHKGTPTFLRLGVPDGFMLVMSLLRRCAISR